MTHNNNDYPLSDTDIRKMLHNDVNIITYDTFKNLNNIMDIFKTNNNVCLLYQWDGGGHWVSLIYYPNNTLIEYFGSFGVFPDSQLLWDAKMRDPKYGQEHMYLLNLIIKWLDEDKKHKFEYNDYDFQSKNGTYTCGRWCVYRILHKNLSLPQFIELTKKYNDNDIITLTDKLL